MWPKVSYEVVQFRQLQFNRIITNEYHKKHIKLIECLYDKNEVVESECEADPEGQTAGFAGFTGLVRIAGLRQGSDPHTPTLVAEGVPVVARPGHRLLSAKYPLNIGHLG